MPQPRVIATRDGSDLAALGAKVYRAPVEFAP
jgi:hypothetical protein